MRTVDKIVDVLEEAGIDHVFGLPGGDTGQIFKALYDKQDRIRVVLARDEQTAACMADMYGRLTGKPGVFMAQGCYAASTGLFGVIEAGLGSSPMLVITDITTYGVPPGHGSLQCGGGEYGNFDIAAIFKATCKFTAVAHSPGEGVQAVQRAIKHAVTGRPGPTAAVLAIESLRGEITDDTFPRIYDTRGYMRNAPTVPHPGDVECAVQHLLAAQRPVIVAGNGVHAAKGYAELLALAEALGIPVATSTLGKGAFAEAHPLALGGMGIFGSPVANKVVSEADLVFIVGCRLKGPDTITESPHLIDPRRQTLIQLDVEPRNAGWVFPIELGLIGDAKATLAQLNEALSDGNGTRPPYAELPRFAQLQADKQALDYFDDGYSASGAVPILPQRLARELSDTLDPDAIVCADAGNNRVWMLRYFQTRAGRQLFRHLRHCGHELVAAGSADGQAAAPGPPMRVRVQRWFRHAEPRAEHGAAIRRAGHVCRHERRPTGHGAPGPGGPAGGLGVRAHRLVGGGAGLWLRGPQGASAGGHQARRT